ncbi:MAG: trypsin-like peptidase domain-containing protein [Pirellulales bacterium]|nr:trypsin-like peptidase domain-containing protein [Pirellulales bacterium]
MIPSHRFRVVVFCRWALVAFVLFGAFGSPAFSWADSDPPAVEADKSDSVPKDLQALRAIETKFKKVAAESIKSVVGIEIRDTRGRSSRGSGVIVSRDGLILTAGHVAKRPGTKATFTMPDGKTYKGVSLGIHSSADAGMMKITDKGKWPCVKLAPKDETRVGDWCVAIGHPLGYKAGRPPVVRMGRVLRVEARAVQTDCPLIVGDSGGPLFNLDGKVIGINSRIGSPMSMNYHVPIDIFHDHWDRLKKGEVWVDATARDARPVKAVFREVVADASKCVVQIRCHKKNVVLGTIVGPDGWILTKASELKSGVVVRLPDGRDLEARTIGVNPRFDLAMLKVDAMDLPKISWSLKDPEVGQWVVAAGIDKDPLAIGVISLPRRPIPAAQGSLGVTIAETEKGVTIIQVLPKSPAAKAGLQKNDVITHLQDKRVKDQKALTAVIKKLQAGMEIKLTVKRGEETLEKTATLGKLVTPATQKRDSLNEMGVGVSRRHDNFPLVLQHDSVLRPVDCGGPLVTLDGKAVGVNVARGGRTETYCVPSNALIVLMYDLMSGRLRPETEKEPGDEDKAKAKPEPEAEPKPEAKPAPKAEPKPEAKPAPEAEPKPEAKPAPEAEPKPEAKPAPEAKPKPEAKPAPEAKPKPEAEPAPKAEPKPEAQPVPKAEPKPEAQPVPKAEPKPEAQPAPKAEPKPEAEPAKKAAEAKEPEKKESEKQPAKEEEPKIKAAEEKKPAAEGKADDSSEAPEADKPATNESPGHVLRPTRVGEPHSI